MPNTGLGSLELAVLVAVARLGEGEAYGLGVRREVSETRDHDYSVGAIYTTLSRLEEKGLVESWTTEPRPERGGRSRREYRVTGAGRASLRESAEIAARLWGLDAGLDPA